jgi:DNA-directed RNA polymerase specialized sigma24 family protein
MEFDSSEEAYDDIFDRIAEKDVAALLIKFALNKLSITHPKNAQIINLFMIHGKEHKEIAKYLKITSDNSRQLYHRGMEVLKNMRDEIIEFAKANGFSLNKRGSLI